MADPVRVHPNSINIIAGGRLRSGDVISARVTEVLPGHRFRILWNSRTLTAESRLPLAKGQTIRARVIRDSHGTTLRLLGEPPPAGGHAAADATNTRHLLIDSFLKASMALPSDGVLDRMSSLLSRCRGVPRRLARLYADLAGRGAEPSADFLEALDRRVSGSGGRPNDGGSRDGEASRWETPPDADELAADMREEGETDSLLTLVNRAPSRGIPWLFARSRRRLGDGEIDMAWKIRPEPRPALALTVRDGDRVLEFLLEGRDPVCMEVHAVPDDAIPRDAWDGFRRRLALLNFQVGDTILTMEDGDGFTPDSGGADPTRELPS